MKTKTHEITMAAVITAAYVVLTLPFAQFSFGIIQFRLAEAMTVLAVLTPAAIPGLTIGCLLANLLNPNNLGPVDILVGSLATFLSAWLSWKLSIRLRQPAEPEIDRQQAAQEKRAPIRIPDLDRRSLVPVRHVKLSRIAAMISPAVVLNALIVGSYLPFLLLEHSVTGTVGLTAVIGSILSIFLCEAIVVYLLGLPLLLGLARTRLPMLF